MEPETVKPRTPVVLLVDDEDTVRFTARRQLWAKGFAVIEACDGKEALEVLDTQGINVDVILSDISMPRVNGIELSNLLLQRSPGWPLLLASADAQGALSKYGTPPTGVDIVDKPFDFEDLFKRIRAMLEKSAGWPDPGGKGT